MASKQIDFNGLIKFKNAQTCFICGNRISEGYQKVRYSPGGAYLVQWCEQCKEGD